MILKSTSFDLTIPDPSSSQFIYVTTFIEKDIAWFKQEIINTI